jgi:hypothetical protein
METSKMNKYSVRVVKKKHEVRVIDEKKVAVVYTDDVFNVLVGGNTKQEARKNLRKIDKYSNATDYRIGRVTKVKSDELDGYVFAIKEARFKKHWELSKES